MLDQFTQDYWNRKIEEALRLQLHRCAIAELPWSTSNCPDLQAVTGPDAGANFHTWAVWGSRKAGVTIRQEDLGEALKNATVVSGIVGLLWAYCFVGSIRLLAIRVALDHCSALRPCWDGLWRTNGQTDCNLQSE